MSTRLQESDFLSINIRDILNGSKSDDPAQDNQRPGKDQAQQDKEQDQENNKKRPSNFDWEAEYKKRIADNNKLSPEARKDQAEIEKRFWYEFFAAGWPREIAEYLNKGLGDLLKKDIRALGFRAKTNPLLAFLKLPYVQKNLLLPKLLNYTTYKGIRTAVADSLMPESAFYRVSDYNIIYCLDLYNKNANTITAYLKQQSHILKPGAGVTSLEVQQKNRRAFFAVGSISGKSKEAIVKAQLNAAPEKLPSAKGKHTLLNKLEVVEAITGHTVHKRTEKTEVSSKELAALASKITNPATILAIAQYFALTSNSDIAKKAISDQRFSKVKASRLLQLTPQVNKWFADKSFSDKTTDAFLTQLLANLDSGKSD